MGKNSKIQQSGLEIRPPSPTESQPGSAAPPPSPVDSQISTPRVNAIHINNSLRLGLMFSQRNTNSHREPSPEAPKGDPRSPRPMGSSDE